MKISINGELILQNPIYIDIINLLSRSGYRVHITCDIQHSDQVKEILKEKKCVYEDIKFYNFENKYKIYQINNYSYILDNDLHFLDDDINSMFASTSKFCIVNDLIKETKKENVIVTSEIKNIIPDIIKYEKNIKEYIEDPITVLSGKPSIDKPYKKYYTIDQTNINIPNMNIWEYISLSNYGREDEVAIRYFGATLTFRDLTEKVNDFSQNLINNGVKPGDVVTICMPNTPEGVIAFLATNKIGAVANMLHPLLKADDIKDTLQLTQSKIMIMADMCYPEVNKIIGDTNLNKVIVTSPSDSMPIVSNIQFGIKLLYIAKEKIKKLKNKTKLKKLKVSLRLLDNSISTIENSLSLEISKLESSLKKISYKDKLFIKWKDFNKNSAYSYNVETINNHYSGKGAVLLRTGGTTGKSKLAELSNENVIANLSQVRESLIGYKTGDEVLAISPIFHGFGLIDSVLAAMALNMSVDLHPQYNKPIFIKSMLKNKPRVILGVPTLWKNVINDKKLKDSDLEGSDLWISGGDSLPEELKSQINQFKKNHNNDNNLLSGYGFTEGGAAITLSSKDSDTPHTVGRPLPHNIFKIVNKETQEECGYNEVGEILVSGPTIMNGYYLKPDSTDRAISIDSDGRRWYHTGDLAYMNETGEVCFAGRDKNMIVVSGINIFGSEIEPIISKIPEVLDCAVVGMKHNIKMNVAMAYVVLKEGMVLTEELKNKIIESCNSQVDAYHKIYDVVQIDKIPLTSLSKIDYKILATMNDERYNNNANHRKR